MKAIVKNKFFDESLSSQDIRKIVGRKIRNLRERRMLTQEQLGEAIGKRREQIARIESGHSAITLDLLLALSSGLDAHPFFFLENVVTLDWTNQ